MPGWAQEAHQQVFEGGLAPALKATATPCPELRVWLRNRVLGHEVAREQEMVGSLEPGKDGSF